MEEKKSTKPGSTSLTGGYFQLPSTLHFHYLRAANGGLLEEANSFEQHVAQLSGALGGSFPQDRIRAFIERFVRPRGIATPVTALMADEIEQAARIKKRPRRPAPWHY